MTQAGRILVAAFGLAAADASADPLVHVKFGVTLEGYYEFNTNRPHDRVNDLRADFQFGQATETTQGNPANEPRPEVYRNLWQVYGTYVFPVGRGLQMDFGKFASNLGYETNYAKDNSQFSRAYLFNFLPFYHSGLRLSLPVSESVTLMYMLTNGIQQTEDFNDSPSHHVSVVIRPNGKLSWTASCFLGKEQDDRTFRVGDTYVSWTMTQRFSVGLDVSYTTLDGDPALSLFGVGAYARWQPGDASSELFFTGLVPGDLRDHQDTILVGAVWWFGNKQGAW